MLRFYQKGFAISIVYMPFLVKLVNNN